MLLLIDENQAFCFSIKAKRSASTEQTRRDASLRCHDVGRKFTRESGPPARKCLSARCRTAALCPTPRSIRSPQVRGTFLKASRV